MRYHDFVLQDDVRTIHGIDMYVLYFRGVNEANQSVVFVLQRDRRFCHLSSPGVQNGAILEVYRNRWYTYYSTLTHTYCLEIDNESLKCAEHNIQINKLEDRIRLMRASPDGSILFPLEGLSGQP